MVIRNPQVEDNFPSESEMQKMPDRPSHNHKLCRKHGWYHRWAGACPYCTGWYGDIKIRDVKK